MSNRPDALCRLCRRAAASAAGRALLCLLRDERGAAVLEHALLSAGGCAAAVLAARALGHGIDQALAPLLAALR